MKIRSGFVSNSSSSSFVILGKYIDIDSISFDTIKEFDIYAFGEYLSEAQDVFKIDTPEMLAFLKAYHKLGYGRNNSEFEFVKSFLYVPEDNDEIDLDIIPKVGKVNIIQGDKDYNSTYSIDDMKRRYDKDDIISNEMIKIFRTEKINKIEKK